MNRASVVVIAIVVVAALAGAALYYHYSQGTVEVYVQGDPSFAVYITVSSVMLHSESGGWITLSNSSTTVQLTNSPQLLTSSTIPAGNYTELRMVVSSAEVTIGLVNVTASVPSGVLKIPIIRGGLHVTGGSTAKLEVLMGPHLVSTGNGQYMLSPVVTAEQIS
ncbi:DUF4382 domain-containing protein [Conexivisphaera calida]|uniref:DUF4382 domain-containing protein n=1 Tax=Conexivisphaera calida TaxID=1874277 RepID=A0A4P2VJJ1_9ARCH|nr:DUF4382 domain-containing protein [Conexivisphaera calida]BBE41488.1 hypothetical protein NAS2_0075 [Conexivisphaera calida]